MSEIWYVYAVVAVVGFPLNAQSAIEVPFVEAETNGPSVGEVIWTNDDGLVEQSFVIPVDVTLAEVGTNALPM